MIKMTSNKTENANECNPNFGEIWTIFVNLHKKNNRSDQNNVASLVREQWGVTAPEPPPIQNSNISDFGEIWTIYVNLHEKSNEMGENSLGGRLRGLGRADSPD